MHYFIVFTILLAAIFIIKIHFISGDSQIITSDGLLYYSYLPSIFYNNFDFSFIPQDLLRISETNHIFIKYPYGVSFMIFPFFCIAHIITALTGGILDGFSLYFQIFAAVSTLFYYSLGVLLNYSILRKFFNSAVSLLVCIAVSYGTGIFYYLIYDIVWAHIYSYCLISMFIWLIVYKNLFKNKLFYNFLFGLCLGLITIVRNINCLIILIYIFYGVFDTKTIKEKIKNIISPSFYLPFIFGCLIFVIPMCLYWYSVSGHFIFNTYTPIDDYYTNTSLIWDNEPDSFNWLNPRIFDSLFSLRKGLFIYYPVLIYSFFGLFYLKKYAKEFSYSIPIFFLPVIYLYSAWIGWHGGDSFGNRFYLDYICVFSVPMAAFIKRILESRSKYKKLTLLSIFILLTAAAVIMTCMAAEQYSYGSGTLFGAFKPVKPD